MSNNVGSKIFITKFTAARSHEHGQPCPVCRGADARCIVNVHLVDAWNEEIYRYTCDKLSCINDVISEWHFGDNDPLVEVSTAPHDTVPAGQEA